MRVALLISIGGALGTLARYLVGVGISRWLPGPVPWATLTVNVLGSFAIGLVMAIFAARGQLDSDARLAVTVGVLGGFTTYSAFALELVSLARERELPILVLYLVATVVLGAGACALGLWAGRALS